MFPPNIKDWLPENHLANFVSDVVDQLNLSAIEAVYEKDSRGQPPYSPRMMTKLLLYGYCVGIFSSRRIQRALAEEIPFRVLAAGNNPDFRTISDFRKIHHKALQELFEQVLAMALKAGAIKLGRVALDGSKVKANASKHKAMSYDRMRSRNNSFEKRFANCLESRSRRCT
jgi:transposase